MPDVEPTLLCTLQREQLDLDTGLCKFGGMGYSLDPLMTANWMGRVVASEQE